MTHAAANRSEARRGDGEAGLQHELQLAKRVAYGGARFVVGHRDAACRVSLQHLERQLARRNRHQRIADRTRQRRIAPMASACSMISNPTVPCPAMTSGSSNGCT